ncbi:MAG TPA: hypothetical protein PKW42_05740 [bacterium]|nr:hypothetical protein [bacterium]
MKTRSKIQRLLTGFRAHTMLKGIAIRAEQKLADFLREKSPERLRHVCLHLLQQHGTSRTWNTAARN